MNPESVRQDIASFKPEFEKITRARHPFEIRHFIVGQHESRWRQWYQICIEVDAKWRAIQEAEAAKRLAELEIEELELKKERIPDRSAHNRVESDRQIRLLEIHNEKLDIEIRKKTNQLTYHETLMTGALKEVADFIALAKAEYSEFWGKSEEELVALHEDDYWVQRLSRQLAVDIMTFGRAQAGNITCVLQIPASKREKVLKLALNKADKEMQAMAMIENQNEAEVKRLLEIQNKMASDPKRKDIQ